MWVEEWNAAATTGAVGILLALLVLSRSVRLAVLRHTVGRWGRLSASASASMQPPRLTQVQGVARDALYVQWETQPRKNGGGEWLLERVEVQLRLENSETWKRRYFGRGEDETLVEQLAPRTQYWVRVRTWLGRSQSEWTQWKTPVWTLTERTPQGGSTGPLAETSDEYRWSQGDNEVEVLVPLSLARSQAASPAHCATAEQSRPPLKVKRKDVEVEIRRGSLNVQLLGQPLLKGELSKPVTVDDCFWELVFDNQHGSVLQITLAKEGKMKNWDCVLAGHPPIELF